MFDGFDRRYVSLLGGDSELKNTVDVNADAAKVMCVEKECVRHSRLFSSVSPVL